MNWSCITRCSKKEANWKYSWVFFWSYWWVMTWGRDLYVVLCSVWMLKCYSGTVMLTGCWGRSWNVCSMITLINSTYSFTVVIQKCLFSDLLTTSKSTPSGKWNLCFKTPWNQVLKVSVKMVQGFSTKLVIKNSSCFHF